MSFFKYWYNDWHEANDTERHILVCVFLCGALLLSVPIMLIVSMLVHKANVDREAAEWLVYKSTNKCVAVAQKPPQEKSRIVGKMITRELEAGDVVWKCNNGIVVRSWEKSK